MSALKITLDVSDTPAAVLKNSGFLIYDKYLILGKGTQPPALLTVMFNPAKKGHTYKL